MPLASQRPVATLDPRDQDAAAELLTRAFDDEPGFLAVLPDQVDRQECLLALFQADLANALRHGGAVTVRNSAGDLAGVAYWTIQPEPHRSDAEMVELGFANVLARWGSQLGPLAEIESASHRRLGFLATPWRYLAGIGVRPDLQGQGFGTAMLQHLITEADTANQPLGLSTDRAIDVTFYERAGIRIVYHDPETSIGVPFWTMLYLPPTT